MQKDLDSLEELITSAAECHKMKEYYWQLVMTENSTAKFIPCSHVSSNIGKFVN